VLAGFAARSVARAITATRSGSASTLPGKVANLVAPTFLSDRAARLTKGFALVTGTNGKTTTAAMSAAVLRAAGRPLVHNTEGANLLSGIATAFALQAPAPFALLEVDEAALPQAVARLGAARAVVLTNVFRDQLDRYGEIDRLTEGWRTALRGSRGAALIANADDPLVAYTALQSELPVVFFGIDPGSDVTAAGAHEVSDAAICPRCGARLEYRSRWMGHLGRYRCAGCDFARPRPALLARDIALSEHGAAAVVTTPSSEVRLSLKVAGLHSIYNALAALGLTSRIGVDPREAVAALARYHPVFGRSSVYSLRGALIRVSLTKNPAGLNQTLRTLRTASGYRALVFVLNDNIADGRDISWVWDADLESLLPSANAYVACGTRAQGMALRLKYAGVPRERLTSARDLRSALDALIARGERAIDVLPTYTALDEVRSTLRAEGAATVLDDRA